MKSHRSWCNHLQPALQTSSSCVPSVTNLHSSPGTTMSGNRVHPHHHPHPHSRPIKERHATSDLCPYHTQTHIASISHVWNHDLSLFSLLSLSHGAYSIASTQRKIMIIMIIIIKQKESPSTGSCQYVCQFFDRLSCRAAKV